MHVVRKRTAGFLVAAVILVTALTMVSRRTRPPVLPPDATHGDLSGNEDCAPCHAEGAAIPLSRGHPPKDDCLHCHLKAK